MPSLRILTHKCNIFFFNASTTGECRACSCHYCPITTASVTLFASVPSTVSHFKWHTKCKGPGFLGGGLRKIFIVSSVFLMCSFSVIECSIYFMSVLLYGSVAALLVQ